MTFFILAVKYNEDFEIPSEYYMEVAKRLKVFTCQNQVNQWQLNLLQGINFKLYVTKSIYNTWRQIIKRPAQITGPHPYKMIQNYFKKPLSIKANVKMLLKKSVSLKVPKSRCVILLQNHIFKDKDHAQRFYGESSTMAFTESFDSDLSL
jgi:hypothetical protein